MVASAPSFLVLALLAAAGVAAYLAAVGLLRKEQPGALAFSLLMGATLAYSFGYAVELSSSSLDRLLFWTGVEYLGIATMPVFWLHFALDFRGIKIGRLARGLLLLPSALVILLVWTNESHRLYYASVGIRRIGRLSLLAFERGPGYWLNTAYAWILFALGTAVLLRGIGRSGRELRRQSYLAAAAGILPWIANLLYLAGFVPLGLDLTAFAVALSGLFFALALFRYSFLALIPEARERVLESLEEGMVVLDRHGKIADANPAAESLLGLPGGALGRDFGEETPERPDIAALAALGEGSAEFSRRGEGGEERFYRARAFPVKDGRSHSLGTAILIDDVTETTLLLRKLTELASTDGLTGALNRRRFYELGRREFELARRAGRPLSVAILDLDHFKEINDSFGHATGDLALIAVTEGLRAGLRATDLFCRYGGEEFAILFAETGPEGAMKGAERVRSALAELRLPAEPLLSLSGSFGLYGGVPEPEESLDRFLARADEALYRAKEEGRNRCVRWIDEHPFTKGL